MASILWLSDPLGSTKIKTVAEWVQDEQAAGGRSVTPSPASIAFRHSGH
jgi:hypothetical protein